ncbi:putative ATP-binding protein YbiT [Alteromonas macleodii]|mgnify:FL=1|uniref:Probable ATP-binding protein YbiT n=2 Tax=Alteromonas macleodii TaxID=28108 RepID=A0A1E7DH67_ALTMA|nr:MULTISPECIES: ABC-F family ATPase [Alteromonas]MEC7132407.1 ABC-F family ATPase [Pseudomonadota bacterium]NKX20341.1 ABC-F family ATPase [Alteromonadaceae bacterium A_SAG2]NKX30238.1 ABC-F family ATPase [Alteromonadaceae bacterium A_SAG1]AFS39383.1 ABC transporter ATP-binding protein [Alteromonas macleodii ATCC 27126]AFT73521.1 ABC transporter ATP-binding protein [Alteromonas macleodii str. 'English Channel 673']
MITTANITMQFGSKPLFENISAKFGNGNRYGLIGANGCGKSTFMKILSGKLTPSSGNVSMAPGTKLGILSQDQFAFEEFSVVDTVIMGDRELWEVKQERDAIYSKAEMSEEDGMRVADLETQFAEMDGYTAEARAGDILNSAGIDESYHFGLMKEVAPGKKVRVLLAQALFAEPDILLLDEPTNNLDIYTISWLAEELNKRKSTMLIISHDRHFLNSVCTHMADIDYGELRVYPGNYDDYIQAAMLVQEQLHAENAKKSAEIEELQSFVARFSANASKAKQATSRARRLEKIELAEVKASSRRKPYIVFNQHKKLHRLAITLEELGHSYPDLPLFDNANLLLEAGQRLAIIGENGAGKTTLLKCLVNDIEPTAGSYKWAENAAIGYIPQDNAKYFAEDITMFEWMSQWRSPKHDDLQIKGMLGRLLFTSDDFNKRVQVCSGGEKNRLLFGKLMLQDINVLVMDEPTNHMDMESIEALNNALYKFDGTVIFVSHDREFVSSLATQIIEIKDKKLNHFDGNYEEFLAHKENA